MTKPMQYCFMVLLLILPFGQAYGIVDEENKGQWGKPTNNGPDKEVPGFLVNLGPTGARAILKKKSFVVKYIFKNTPASKVLKVNDEIIGVNGKRFENEHVFGKFYGIEPTPGWEGPFLEFARALEEAEGEDGRLNVMVVRGDKTINLTIGLGLMGRFSPTFPADCKKSEELVKDALRYLLKQEDLLKGMCHEKGTVGLALLSQGRTREAKMLAESWNTIPSGDVGTWAAAYQCIFLSEYYLRTNDRRVKKTIEGLVDILCQAQVDDIANYKGRTFNGEPQDHNFLTGGLGHSVNIALYGTMTTSTLLAMLAWELAEECGVKVEETFKTKAYECIKTNTHETGYMGYRFAGGAYSPVPRQGLSLIVHNLSDKPYAKEYMACVASGLEIAKERMNDGHGDNVLGFFWGLMGIQVSGDEEKIRSVLDYNKALINMSRTHDGSFVAQPGRNCSEKGYYLSSRLHPTAAMILILGTNKPTLRLQKGQ